MKIFPEGHLHLMNHRIDITTIPTSDGRITQTVCSVLDSVNTQLMRTVLNTSDQQIRDALIELGWTPPSDERKRRDADKERKR